MQKQKRNRQKHETKLTKKIPNRKTKRDESATGRTVLRRKTNKKGRKKKTPGCVIEGEKEKTSGEFLKKLPECCRLYSELGRVTNKREGK